MGDLYLFDFSGDEEERNRREEEDAQERSLVRVRYAEHLRRAAGIDEVTADLVLAALFDHSASRGSRRCLCSCHPQLPDGALHDAGFDCSCTWSDSRREAEHRDWKTSLEEYCASP